MPEKILHKKLTITGRVQGVAFRKNTQQMAKKLGVAGMVKNCDNGSVYIEAEGTQIQLDLLIAWCHKGSPFSKVETITIKDGALHYYHIFEIV